jgi:NADH dehydrogenase
VSRDAVTGATSYTGRFIAEALTAHGREISNLTRAELASPTLLDAALRGADTLYNTFWIRFERGAVTYDWAIQRSRDLFAAASRAGVRRVVHISVINPARDAPTAYFRAKAVVEEALLASGLPHAIVRPTVTYGPADILVNNLAWTLRHLPVFGVPGDGQYPIQPVHVEDVAEIAVRAGGATENLVVEAAGPEVFAFDEFVALVRKAVRSRALVVHLPVSAALLGARLIGIAVRDVVLTRHEVTELEERLMFSRQPPAGRIHFADWLAVNGAEIGRHWSSELDRHFRR